MYCVKQFEERHEPVVGVGGGVVLVIKIHHFDTSRAMCYIYIHIHIHIFLHHNPLPRPDFTDFSENGLLNLLPISLIPIYKMH